MSEKAENSVDELEVEFDAQSVISRFKMPPRNVPIPGHLNLTSIAWKGPNNTNAIGYNAIYKSMNSVEHFLKNYFGDIKKAPLHILGTYWSQDSNRNISGLFLFLDWALAGRHAILVNRRLQTILRVPIYDIGADSGLPILHSVDDTYHYGLIHAVGYEEGEEQEQLKEQLPDHIEIKHYAHDDHERLKEDIEAHRSSSDSDDESGDE